MAVEKTPRNEMPVQDAAVRRHNFDEVALGYTPGQAMAEAARCLGCKNAPCRGGCPVSIDIPAFLAKTKEGDFAAAYDILSAASSLPAVCGRVCPQESQCEQVCLRARVDEAVAIGRVERFVADWHARNPGAAPAPVPSTGKRAAVVGSGPSGLACAGELARRGHAVTIFEALHLAGGVLRYGIPEFRLPKAIVDRELNGLAALGVDIQVNTIVGKTLTIEELLAQYDSVYLASGAGLPGFMNIPGENLPGVQSANEFLTRVNLMGAYKKGAATPVHRARRVAVVGAGNVAMDAARCALRLGADEVSIVYRRSEAEMPARKEEIAHAKEEGVVLRLLTNPVEILPGENGTVEAIKCVEMVLGEPDASGRRRPVTKPGSEFTLPVDSVIMAIGTSPNPLLHRATPALETDRRGCIVAKDAAGATSLPGVWAGGDAVTGAATVILAMGAGKAAAQAMDAYMSEK